ncbi:phospholipase D-like domain-containing protein [uncultured Draconibacterium sp.]|uniref:phospholipase D-like domain-containing protein n=1 Tax=uncultured Draconibacterium sp. TaxID=1573823 RepID=UPI0025F025D0|nr:phospholipase D-like domain-containing protein [uncultured Draconibacterium sp.]
MRYTILTLFILLSYGLHAQISIDEARKKEVGAIVTISGTVTNGSELGTIRYIQDKTAGIGIYDNALTNLQRGDSVTVTGELDDFNNLLEITAISNYTKHASGVALPNPQTINIRDIGEDYEAELLKLNNVRFVNAGGQFAGNENYDFTDGTDTGVLRINSSSPLVGQAIPTGEFDLIAICSQYSWTNNDTRTGYQLLPRDANDFISGNSIHFTTAVHPINTTTNAITLEWNTDVEGTSEIRYGSTMNTSALDMQASGSSTQNNDEYTHQVQITGLQDAEIIYVQAFSATETDTAFSAISAFVTKSNSSGKINAYFNSAIDDTQATKNTAMNIGNAMPDTLIAYINRAKATIDFCIYNINNAQITDALNAANNRGVTIRFITCESTAHVSTSYLNNNIPVLERPELAEGGLMHNKFVIFDANTSNPNDAWVWSGSTNLTEGQLFTDANNMIFIQDQALARVYELEFEEMWGSSNEQPNAGNAKFGDAKINNTPHTIQVGDIVVECFFSPSDNTNQQLINAMNSADNDLSIETMLITRSDLANAITDAYDRGVNVSVLSNYSGDNTETVNNILGNTLPDNKYIFDDVAAGVLHHKIALIDAQQPDSDPQVITGSHNWSNSANDRNDENTLIIHDADLANQYYQQFAYRFEQNNGTLVLSALQISSVDLKVFPNPTEGQLTLSATQNIVKITMVSSTGSIIKEWHPNTTATEINLPNQITGLFILEVELKNGTSNSYKILKK